MDKIIIPISAFTRSGGMRVLCKLADYLIDRGYIVTFVVPVTFSTPYYPTKANVISVPSSGSKWRAWVLLTNLFSIWRKARTLPADYVIANHYLTAYISLFLPSKLKKLYYIQAYEVKLSRSFAGKIFAFVTYWLPLSRVVNSPYLLPKWLPKPLGVVPAGLDLALYKNSPKMYSSKNTIQLGCVGRVESYKGTKEIVTAFEALASRYELLLNVAVHMPSIPESIRSQVRFFPVENDEQLADFYKRCDIVVATGLIEDKAFHYPCAEGMAAGKVVISNYSPLALRNGTSSPALILENVNAESIQSAIEFAINMSGDQQSSEVLENLETVNGYSWDAVGEKFISCLLRV